MLYKCLVFLIKDQPISIERRKMKKIFRASHLGTDGRDPGTIGFFADFPSAENAVKGKGPMGHGNGRIVEEVLYENYGDYCYNNPRAVRERAMAKLTAEEKQILGL